MELILICIILFLGKSVQELDSEEEVNNILDKLINQIKYNNTIKVNNASKADTNLDVLNDETPDESKIIYLKTLNKPIIDFISEYATDVTDMPQEYQETSKIIPVQDEINENDNILKEILREIKSLNKDTEDDVKSDDGSKIKLIKDDNNPIINDVQDNVSSIIVPLETQDTRRNLDNFSLPQDLLDLIKENYDKGIILKEVIVEIVKNAENNSNINVLEPPRSGTSKLTEISEDSIVALNNKTQSNSSSEYSKPVINKKSDKKINQNKDTISRRIKKKQVDDTKKQLYMNSYVNDRTVPPEMRQIENSLLNSNIPQLAEVSMIPTPTNIENFEWHPYLSSNTPSKPCDDNCLKRKLLSQYVYPLRLPKISYVLNVTPRSTKLQIDRALQDTYSISRSLLMGPAYYKTDFMNRIRSRMVYKPLYNNFVYI